MTVRIVYSDLDGTMVGPGGCFFLAENHALTLDPARALLDLHRARIPLVLVSGRTRVQLLEACGVFGADGFVGELGSVLGWELGRQHEVLRGAMPELYGAATPAEVIEEAGLPGVLFARWPGRLEYHAPWHIGHEADVMLRGRVDVAQAEAELAAAGYSWLRLHDNGVLPDRAPSSLHPDALPAHVYHLMPAGLSKGGGVARDLSRRGLSPEQAIGIGDSSSDLSMAPYVRRFFLTANGMRHLEMRRLVAAYDNVEVCSQPVGLGWVEALRRAWDG